MYLGDLFKYILNNYSFLEQLLHKTALSSRFLKEMSFDLEKSYFLKYCDDYPDNHVFIAGLARSGTTILLNSIYQTGFFGSLSYDDMPFILSPNLWSKISGNGFQKESNERAHGDGIIISTNSPEAFEEVFWMTFKSRKANKEEISNPPIGGIIPLKMFK